MTSAEIRPVNKLLRLLTRSAYLRVAPKLKPTTLRAKQVLYRPDQPIDSVYFPETAVICQMNVMTNGDTLETGTVGLEGASWISASIGAPSMPCETIVAIRGTAHALDIADLDREMRENEPFRDVLTQYSHALLIHSMRLTACTGLHSLEQRCARWMLTTLDRVPEDHFSITHEFLAMLLGASRPAVSGVIEKFARQGMLRIARGRVLIDDRTRLLDVTCDCHAVIRHNYEQVGRGTGASDQRPAPASAAEREEPSRA
jgi:CRP-like cAMP-binding protein